MKRKISIFMCIALIISSLFGLSGCYVMKGATICFQVVTKSSDSDVTPDSKGIKKGATKPITNITNNNGAPGTLPLTTTSPYYSVTNANTISERNEYMRVNARIPMITYSNESEDALIDMVNETINQNVNELIETSKENAKNTYDAYFESVKNNIINDRNTKINKLKDKYKDILGESEYTAIENALKKEPETNNFFDSKRIAFDRPFFIRETPSEVNGFSDSEPLIIDGLHNKRIIVIETTEPSSMMQTTTSIEGRPGKEMFDKSQNDRLSPTPQIAPPSGTPTKTESENNQINERPKDFTKPRFATPATAIPATTTPTITPTTANDEENAELDVHSFYAELDKLEATKIPNKFELIRNYTPMTINCGYDIKCLDEDYISLYIELTETRNQTAYKRCYYNIDLKNKKLISIEDVLGTNYQQIIIPSINNDIINWSDEKKSDLKNSYDISKYINEDTPFFINNNHMPVIILEKNTITVGGAGYHEFQIII